MWVAKFKIKHDCWILSKTLTYGFSAVGVPLNSFKKDGKMYHTGFDILKGTEKSKTAFVNSLGTDRRVKKAIRNGDHLFTLIEGEDFIANIFDPSLFFISPVLQEDGYEYWDLGSWNRKTLLVFFQKAKEFADIKILKLKKEVPALVFHRAMPSLTEKQQCAFQLAQELGYYDYPRKITVTELAKKMREPRTTVQEHLRKAEAKVMAELKRSF